MSAAEHDSHLSQSAILFFPSPFSPLGSGKSTLLMALFRIVEGETGTVLIDGIDTSKLNLQQLRGSLSILPQEPVAFTGTIRSNIDPFLEHTDEECWEALEMSHMASAVRGMPGELHAPVVDSGRNLSLGHKQLLCLARAALNHSSVLCLDEATAAVDLATDALFQKTVNTHPTFKNRTVLTIAHRLDTVINSDYILAMDAGRMMELDTPVNLLKNPDSFFYQLVDSAGDRAEALRNAAFAHAKQREAELNQRPVERVRAATVTQLDESLELPQSSSDASAPSDDYEYSVSAVRFYDE